MLDISYIREHQAEIQKAAELKRLKFDVGELIEVADRRGKLQLKIDELKRQRNQQAAGQKGKPDATSLAKARQLKESIGAGTAELEHIDKKFHELMALTPTIPSPDTPVGESDQENKVVYTGLAPRKFEFEPKSYQELAQRHDLIDFERGAKVAGYRGYYMKNEGALIQLALMMYALEVMLQKGYQPFIPPTLIKEFALFGSGYFAGPSYDPKRDEIYRVENRDVLPDGSKSGDDKFLIGTAEPALLAYYANEVLEEKDLPKRWCGFSQCYRTEIGSYGKDTKGLYRVHEFMKVEQVAIIKADIAEALRFQDEMLKISEELHQSLGLPYRRLQICTGDLSAGKYRQFDSEVWIPSRKLYGESGSASIFLDWQARRLNVSYRNRTGQKKYVYMLNNTALPSPRIMIALLENHQRADGSIEIPAPLRKYLPEDMTEIR